MKRQFLLFVLLCAGFLARAQWVSMPMGIAAPQQVFAMEAVNPYVVWATATSASAAAGQAYLLTVDGGTVWKNGSVNGPAGYVLTNISAVNGQVAWVTLADEVNGGGIIRKTTNGGQSWLTVSATAFAAPEGYPDVIHFFDADSGVVFGDVNNGFWEVYTTANGGTTWNRVLQTALPGHTRGEYALFTKDAIGDTIWLGTSRGRIFRSVNRGGSWTAVQAPLRSVQAIAFSDPMNGLVTGTSGELARSADGGQSWTRVAYTGRVHDYDMVAVPGLPGTFVTTGYDSLGRPGSSFTADYGQTWLPIDTIPHMALAFASAAAGWTSGFQAAATASLYRWRGSLLQLPEQTAMADAYVYPNPGNGCFRLVADIPSGNILVHDALGRTVYAAPAAPAVPEQELQLQHLPKGLYLLSLVSVKGVKQMKLLIE